MGELLRDQYDITFVHLGGLKIKKILNQYIDHIIRVQGIILFFI